MSISSGRRKRSWESEFDPVLDNARLLARKQEDRFIENFLYIKTKEAQLELLRYRQGQREVSRIIQALTIQLRPVRLVIIKSRQVGMSTFCASKVFTRAYGTNNIDGLIIAHDKKRAQKLLQMAHLFYRMLPDEMKVPLERSSSSEIRFGGINSGIDVITGGSAHASRGSTPSVVQASEFPYYDDLYGQMGSLEQAVPFIPGTFIGAEGTANGSGTPAHAFWEAAGKIIRKGNEYILKPGDTAYYQIFLPWHDDPICQLKPFSNMQIQSTYMEQMFHEFPDLKGRMEAYGLTIRQIAWYYETLKYQCYGDELYMCQEYPCDSEEAWVSSGTPIFPAMLLGKYRNAAKEGVLYEPQRTFHSISELTEEPTLDRSVDMYIEVWEPPSPSGRYLIGADGSAGFSDSDFCSAFVIDRMTLNTCAEVHGRFEPDEFAHILASMGRSYNQAIVAPEVTGIGMAILSILQMFYWHIYQWRVVDAYGLKITNRLGWDTNHQSRPMMIAEAKKTFKERARHPETMGKFLPSRALIDELRTFTVSKLNGKPSAASGCFDDRVMAWCISLICTLQEEYGIIRDDVQGGSSYSSNTSQKLGPSMRDVCEDIFSGSW